MPSASIASLKKELTLYLPLDGDVHPRYAAGSRIIKAKRATFTNGEAGQAVMVSKAPPAKAGGQSGVTVPALGNMNPSRGSVAFWVRIAWSPEDTGGSDDRVRVLFTTENFRLLYDRKHKIFRFMTGRTKEAKGYHWDYGTADRKQMCNWKPGQWHQVTATWDAATGKKVLYLDGETVSTHTTDWIRRSQFGQNVSLELGSQDAPGAYDELMIWDRALSADEVVLLAKQPKVVAQRLHEQLPPVTASTAPAWPIDFDIYRISTDDALNTIVKPGETFTAKIPVKNTGDAAWQGTVTFTLLDFWLKPRATHEVDLKLASGEHKVLEAPFKAPGRGVFKVAVRLKDHGETFERDVASFAAWPKPQGPSDPDSFFGYHINSWSDGLVSQAARLGANWNRDHNMLEFTWWLRIRPNADDDWNWNWEGEPQRMTKYGFHVLGQFFGTPWWAAADGPLPKPTHHVYPSGARPDPKAFHEYISETVKHFPQVRYWEVWNEPSVSRFWHGSPEQFAQLCKIAYEAAKAVDPTVTVMNGGYTRAAWKWQELAAKAGALRYADAISFHAYYGDYLDSPEQMYDYFKRQMGHFRKLAHTYAGHDLPIWDTESGSSDTTWLRGLDAPNLPPPSARSPMNWRSAALASVQSSAMLQSLGVVRSFHYLWNAASANRPSYKGLIDLDVTMAPKPELMSRIVMASQVDHADYAGTVRKDPGRLWASVYQKNNDAGSVVLWWTGRGGAVQVKADWPGKMQRRVDMMGNDQSVQSLTRVTEEPSYLHIVAPASAVLAALKAAKITVLTPPEPLPQPQQTAGQQPPNMPQLPAYAAPSENPSGVFTVNLRPYVNMGFADQQAGDGQGGWADEGSLNDLREMPLGRRTFYSVPFDIIDPSQNDGKSIITLRGKLVTPSLIAAVKGIAINQNHVRNLYFLQAASWGKPGTIGKYVIHYADGKTIDVPIRIPQNNGNWWKGYQEGEQSKPIPLRVTNTNDGKPAWRYLRIWEWQNPRPDAAITTLDFISAQGEQTPILIAVTGVTWRATVMYIAQ